MTEPGPRIVVSLPGRTVAELRRELEFARAGGGDLAEIRLDRLDPGESVRLGELFPSPLPLVATLRSRADGGEGPDESGERGQRLRSIETLGFVGVDLEVARDHDLFEEPRVVQHRLVIASTHLPPTSSREDFARALGEATPPGSVRKLVVPASVGRLLNDVLPQLRPGGSRSLAVMTTGPSGPLLRLGARQLGFSLTYASLPESSRTDRPPVESSQVPVDRLRRCLETPGTPTIFGLLGHPVDHSASPSLHARWIEATGRAGTYVALEIESEAEFLESLPGLADLGFRGLNITHPFKRTALAAASRVGRSAEVCGASNCLTLRGSEVDAENTDLSAALRRLEELRGSGRWDGRELVVVGAGGAARATLAAGRELEAATYVVARRAESARELAAAFDATMGTPEGPGRGALVVHATSVGRAPDERLDAKLAAAFETGGYVLDWVYRPVTAEIREIATRAGSAYEDGWRLLVYQAAASFGRWWGEEPSRDDVRSAAEVAA